VEHQIWNLKCEGSVSIDQRSCPFPVAYAALAHPIISAVQISITYSTMHSHTDSVFIITHASGSTSVGNTVYRVVDNIYTLSTCLWSWWEHWHYWWHTEFYPKASSSTRYTELYPNSTTADFDSTIHSTASIQQPKMNMVHSLTFPSMPPCQCRLPLLPPLSWYYEWLACDLLPLSVPSWRVGDLLYPSTPALDVLVSSQRMKWCELLFHRYAAIIACHTVS